MTFSLVHLSDPHFGKECDLQKIAATEALIPDLAPDLVVISGDLTHRARLGEFQAARGWVREIERTAPTYVIPGNHDVQWWRRPLMPFGAAAKYEKFSRYFGPVLAPTHRTPEAVVAGAVTAHGIAWRSLTARPKDLAVTGHLDRREIARVGSIFADADPALVRVLVMHHNILRGEVSDRMGVTRWRKVHRWLMECGADIVLCGHDHLAKADVMGGVIVSTVGTLGTREPDGRPATFHRIVVEESSIQIQCYQWDADRRRFRRTDVIAFARPRVSHAEPDPAGIV